MSHHQFVERPNCIATHMTDPERPRQAAFGLLCAGHYLELERRLAELPALLTDVEDALVRGGSGMGPKVSGTPDFSPLPFVADVSAALTAAHGVTVEWCKLILDEHPDRLHAPADNTRIISSFLLRWLPWSCQQPWADDLVREMQDLTSELRRALSLSRTRLVHVGPCERPLTCDVESHAEVCCPGILTAIVRTLDDGFPRPIFCPDCEESHDPKDWRVLARRLRRGTESWLTSAQLSQLLRVPLGTVWAWAHEDEWRRIDGRPKKYHADDAQQSYEARRAS